MDRRSFLKSATVAAVGLGAAALPASLQASMQAQGHARLPSAGSKSLAEALAARQTQRAYAPEPLPEALLLEVCWAAFGVNRPDGRRTAPSARNRQEIEIWCAQASGLFRYDAQAHALKKVQDKDLRAQTGVQSYAATAPANLVFVADMGKVAGDTPDEKTLHAGLDTGYISQNVYLFCAAAGLATVARTGLDAPALAKAMGLPAEKRVIMAQCVGRPKA